MRARSRRLWTLANLVAGGSLLVQACDRDRIWPTQSPGISPTRSRAAVFDPGINIASVLDSFSIGGVYTVLSISGYPRNAQTIPFAPAVFVYTRPPEDTVYANPISRHPTGIDLPVGLPVRVLAEGLVVSSPTPVFLSGYCLRPGVTDPYCSIGSFSYSVHGLEPGPGVLTPHLSGSGLKVYWSRLGSPLFGAYPIPEFFRGSVPPTGVSGVAELYFTRTAGCCYRIPFGDAEYKAWERYAGRWRFGAVVDDGGRVEFGEPPLLRLSGPRTEAPMAVPADFTLSAVDGSELTDVAWWFIEPANNIFDGVLPDSTVFESAFNLILPVYGASRRSRVSEIAACAGLVTCRYQAHSAGAVIARGTLQSGTILAATNRGNSPTEQPPTIRIIGAGGPNPNGSFIVRSPENRIRLEAEVVPASLASQVTWEVEDAPGDQVSAIPPSAIVPGATSSFVVPDANINRSRWPDKLTDALPLADKLALKSLAFRVTAKISYPGGEIRSASVVVKQDELDTIREEYVEFGQRSVISRADLGRRGDARRNAGADYGAWAAADRLLSQMPKMQALAFEQFRQEVVVTSGYRNPVHQLVHIRARAVNSPHLTGFATDWRILTGRPQGFSIQQYFDALKRLTFDTRVNGCFEPAAVIIDQSPTHTLDHAHTDWPARCSAGWGPP